ncbi:Zn-dependent hydrolase [Rhizobiales bacterium RZME27]|uniref:Zn-dependent hydrolase n=1 Tax=Endobacterium cereale TaxID=2663029 RepID=A0A6A8A7G4_9HYPH|nr:Zn-dependent hydrolase [Endobacterium cereale]MEB2844845.1 Zn-dependent hydrolase [Endobacterium cereale]MQY44761.1 Zn-dependent hydrolase [Endobacterium cereale]
MKSNLPVDATRIAQDIEALSEITEPGRPWTRRAFSPLFLEGRAYVERRMKDAGLETHIDHAGNLIGRRPGRKGVGTLMLGSHSDTVPEGGRFDGIAGLIAALEVARSLSDRGIELDHDLEVVDFLAEEVSPFGVSCIGSRGMTGQRPQAWLERMADGRTLADGIAEVGGDVTTATARDDIKGFLELHIEQGTVLEREGINIGVVTAISGITRIEIIIEGRADHAGTTTMPFRKDALVAASEIVLAIRETGLELSKTPGHFTATVGEFAIEPNAANVVPSRVRMLIDARAEFAGDMELFSAQVERIATQTAERWGVTIAAPERISHVVATPCDAGLLDILEQTAGRSGITHRRMASGAGHDTGWIAKVAPAAMIFVPCKDGRSHSADEWAETNDIALGTAVLFEAVQEMDRRLSEES